MALLVRNDPNRPSGGYVVLEGPALRGVSSLVVENMFSGLFLAPDGRWAKQPHAFAVVPASGDPASLSLGPEIVDAIPTELQLALRSGDGRDLGKLFWVDVLPSRSMRGAAPVRPPPPVPVEPEPVSIEPPPPPGPPTPAPGRSPGPATVKLVAVLAGMLGLVALAYALWSHQTSAIPVAGALPAPAAGPNRCADDFGQQLAGARDSSDDVRIKLAEAALAAGCGAQAFGALDDADWETNEAAAWYLARFYDPNESDPVFHQVAIVHPDWAASYYARWASRSPRQATALKALCATSGSLLDGNTQLKRACGR